MGVMIAVAVVGGLVAALFAKLCDMAMAEHVRMYARAPLLTLLLLPVGFGLVTWITRRVAPEAAGSGIPQVIAAAEHRWSGRWGGQRVTVRTGLWKIVLSAALLLCGGSIGREGPTVQVVAGLMRSLSRGLTGGPGRRAVIIAGGAAGVSAAFNTPIAGVVFAVEELARGFERRTNNFVILVVVVAGFTSYALQGDYAYFGVLQGDPALAGAWLSAPLIGVSGGLLGGLFSRGLALVIGPVDNPVARWRAARPIVFAVLCGVVAAAVALASGGLTFGAGYAEAKNLLSHDQGGGMGFAVAKLVASLAAACSGVPGGIFAPSLATGAGLGAAFAHLGLVHSGRNAVVLGMAGYLSGVVQAPLTSAVILMEMTREPSLVGPLMLTALVARWTAGLLMPEPLYHVLSRSWLPPVPGGAPAAIEPSEPQEGLVNVNPTAWPS
ncbi:MAG: Chloride channel protein EriC [Caulobacteraceae bacterium]|nr:Chloride channel protein EriC [Caulobacteraceae bacterium]